MDKADQYVDRVKHLPPASVLLTPLRKLLSDPNRDGDRLIHWIRHDPGLTAEPAVYADLLRTAGPAGTRLISAEEAKWDVNHADVGGRLLARWGLPHPIVLAALHHHDASAMTEPVERLVATVRIANALAHQLAADPAAPAHPSLTHPDHEALQELRLAPEDLYPILDQTGMRLQQFEKTLQEQWETT